ncbi:PREDICTED: zinc finger BED domain-containing protein RICESLEEPER 1-like [Ipomoea nil]|uniref:zinc finger BED domain-containing protein RICESLEEPER 1-like n=1 Tax=Ipomoea nil TaxID=35883 RepID=UPI000901C476|nr:PREDICTED: zinc finger BED domain-containing protein RICESLEEPER 1-like [Ipomoea nil]
MGKRMEKKLEDMIKDATYKLFNQYKSWHQPSHVLKSGSENLGSISYAATVETSDLGSQGVASVMSRFKIFKSQSGSIIEKTELDTYLGEDIEDEQSFNILHWWKVNQPRFPILAEMARDVLVVPISSVASESTFSTGGRVLDDFRSSLTPKMVEALVCAQDWIGVDKKSVLVEEDCNILENIERDVVAKDLELNIGDK